MKIFDLFVCLIVAVFCYSCVEPGIVEPLSKANMGETITPGPAFDPTKICKDGGISVRIDYSGLSNEPIKPGTLINLPIFVTLHNHGSRRLISVKKDYAGFDVRLSEDGITEGPGSGGYFIDTRQQDVVLDKGDSYTKKWATYPNDLFKYKYVIVRLTEPWMVFDDCNYADNVVVVPIDIARSTGTNGI